MANLAPWRRGTKDGSAGVTDGTDYAHRLADGRVQCALCPRLCKLREGEHGACASRVCRNGRVVSTLERGLSRFRVEPIEAKGFLHLLPGTLALSIGRTPTNLSPRLQVEGAPMEIPGADLLAAPVQRGEIANCAREQGCPSIVLDGGAPVVAFERVIEVAQACRELGLKVAAHTRGYVCPAPRAELYRHFDAVRVELLGFKESFYWKFCGGHIAPVLDTLTYLAQETPLWLEIAVPLVRGENDSVSEIGRLTGWVAAQLGPDIPLHFTAGRLKQPTWAGSPTAPAPDVTRACQIARANGLRYVYTDDLFDPATRNTSCHACANLLIERDWYLVTDWNLTEHNRCATCGKPCSGVFRGRPGSWRDWLPREPQEPPQHHGSLSTA
jgi:pyruvate formate lyase activating enzyme